PRTIFPRISHVFLRDFSRLTRHYTSDAKKNEAVVPKRTTPRPRRALFYGTKNYEIVKECSEERKIKSSLNVTADSIVYDLEDGVASNRKAIAREMIFDVLGTSLVNERSEKAVRINAVGSGMELDDLNVMLRSKNLEGIVIPKVRSADDVKFVSRMIDLIAPDESALAVMNIKQIATSDPRLDALIFAAEDYCADVGIIRTRSRKEMLLARQIIVTAASAYELQAIDLVCVDFRNDDILTEECQEGREMGYVGKQAIHPRQIDIIQKMFLPDIQDVERAARIVYGYEQHSKKGIGAFDLDGKMIDLPMVKWAERILTRATAGGIAIPEIKKDENSIEA
ncbi:25821_t:CDS:10, partial [Dentiscutata erythropus]